jgi:hypothetical protein
MKGDGDRERERASERELQLELRNELEAVLELFLSRDKGERTRQQSGEASRMMKGSMAGKHAVSPLSCTNMHSFWVA